MALVATTGILASALAEAVNVEKLLMPGPLVSDHAKLEEQCGACHDRANRARQRELCLDCHKEIASEVRGAAGFHGRMRNAATSQCAACHSDHIGRQADIVKFNATSFDHALADFRLEGAHRAANCASCHVAGKPWRAASSSCGSCHKQDDRHRGQLGAQCDKCHGTSAWGGGKFEHDKTAFPLRGAHQKIACDSCHVGGRYKPTPRSCVACHAPDDVHRGARGENCAECHTTEGWSSAKFDHAKETKFPLLGRHGSIGCGDCHRSGNLKDPLPRDCVGCHAADDLHAGRFGTACDSCHGHVSWREIEFDHLAKAKFELLGAHARLDCHACHTADNQKQKLGQECVSCHRADDAHNGALGADCASCHGVEKWRGGIVFDHDLTSFPLVGLHVVVSCAQCHATTAFKDAADECLGCHADRDVHKGGLGKDCASCHSPNGWGVWEFDHAKQTGFALLGAHGKLKCANCHRQPAGEVKLPKDCASCHRKDDVHLGQYGTQCQRCHSTVTFKGARIQ